MVGLARVLAWLVFPIVAYSSPQPRAAAVLPSQDSFYKVSDGLESVPPGTILKHRSPPNPIAAFRIFPVNLDASHQILYRTTDSFGNATATVLTVLVPHNANFRRVLSFQPAQDSAARDCAPSYIFQQGTQTREPNGSILTQVELIALEAALEKSWVVIVPDAEGHDAAFLANKLSGQAILDGIRAALNSTDFTGIQSNAAIAMWGYSGGSLTTGWAAELHASYAPELTIVGVAIGGTLPVLRTTATLSNEKELSGLIPAGIVGLAQEYPFVAKSLAQHLLPKYKAAWQKVYKQCSGANFQQFLGQDVFGMFDNKFFEDTALLEILSDNSMGKARPKAPIFVYKAINDEYSPVAETDALVREYCRGGGIVQYVRDLGSNHATIAVTGFPRAFTFLDNAMNGKVPTECSTESVTALLSDLRSTTGVLSSLILDALLDLIGKPVGGGLLG